MKAIRGWPATSSAEPKPLIQSNKFKERIHRSDLKINNAVKNLAPLRSAIGMMEQWNHGIMGSGILEWWI